MKNDGFLSKNRFSLGRRLKLARVAAGYTQKSFAQHLGYTQKMICKYERDESEPSITVLCKIAKFLNMKPSEFLE